MAAEQQHFVASRFVKEVAVLVAMSPVLCRLKLQRFSTLKCHKRVVVLMILARG